MFHKKEHPNYGHIHDLELDLDITPLLPDLALNLHEISKPQVTTINPSLQDTVEQFSKVSETWYGPNIDPGHIPDPPPEKGSDEWLRLKEVDRVNSIVSSLFKS